MFIKEGKQVDYVFGDLTDIPVSPTPHGEVWDFIRLILNKSMQVLKPTGKYMTHVSKLRLNTFNIKCSMFQYYLELQKRIQYAYKV